MVKMTTRVNVYNYDEYEGTTLVGWFDHGAAENLEEARYWDGHNRRGMVSGLQVGYEELYRTRGGRWVRHYNARNEFDGPEMWEFIADEHAREWLLKNETPKHDAAVQKYFGTVEEERGPGRPEVGPAVHIRLPYETLQNIDAYAKEDGVSRAEMIRELLARGMISLDRKRRAETSDVQGSPERDAE